MPGLRASARRLTAVLAAAAVLMTLPVPAGATATPACEVRDRTTPAGVLSDLAGAIAGATTGDTLEVRGTCAAADIAITTPLTIVGKRTNALGAPTIAGSSAARLFRVAPGAATVTFRGLRLTGGNADTDPIASDIGGGFVIGSGTLVLTSVRMSGQVGGAPDGSWGGAIHLGPGTSVVLAGRTTIRGAFAKYGGAIWAENGATVELRDRASIANGPTTGIVAGGAVYPRPAASIVLRDDASIHHVTASGGGGGAIDAQDAIVTLRDAASIHDATATGSWGGAISGLGDLPVITIRDDASLYRNHAVGGTAIASGGTITIAGVETDATGMPTLIGDTTQIGRAHV